MASPRATGRDGIELIKFFEGFSPTVYMCPAGYPTIGYGHVVTAADQAAGRFPGAISKDEATDLLASDLPQFEGSVCRLITVPLHDLCFDALVSFTFNLGGGALQASTLRRLVNAGRLHDASAEFPRWVFAGAQKLPGLVKRRIFSRAMWDKGLSPR